MLPIKPVPYSLVRFISTCDIWSDIDVVICYLSKLKNQKEETKNLESFLILPKWGHLVKNGTRKKINDAQFNANVMVRIGLSTIDWSTSVTQFIYFIGINIRWMMIRWIRMSLPLNCKPAWWTKRNDWIYKK